MRARHQRPLGHTATQTFLITFRQVASKNLDPAVLRDILTGDDNPEFPALNLDSFLTKYRPPMRRSTFRPPLPRPPIQFNGAFKRIPSNQACSISMKYRFYIIGLVCLIMTLPISGFSEDEKEIAALIKQGQIEIQQVDPVGAFEGYILNRRGWPSPMGYKFLSLAPDKKVRFEEIDKRISSVYEQATKTIAHNNTHISEWSEENWNRVDSGKFGKILLSILYFEIDEKPVYIADIIVCGNVMMADTKTFNQVILYHGQTPIRSLDVIADAFISLADEFHKSYVDARAVRGR